MTDQPDYTDADAPPIEGHTPPPQDVTAEQCALGSMMLSVEAIDAVARQIDAEDYYLDQHRKIHGVILDIYAGGQRVDARVVGETMTRAGITIPGGLPYLLTLIQAVPTAANAGYYAQIVRDRAVRRRIIAAGTALVERGYRSTGDTDEVIDDALHALDNIIAGHKAEDIVHVEGAVVEAMLAVENAGKGVEVGLSTGLTDLDRVLNGLRGGQLVVVAARPAVGKSTLALGFARHAAVNANVASLMFSLEMSSLQLATGLLASQATVDQGAMLSGDVSDAQLVKLTEASGVLGASPFYYDESTNLTLAEIRAKATRFNLQRNAARERDNTVPPLGLIVVDYLQLMTAGTSGKRYENRQVEVSEISRGLKKLAMELGVPVVALSQLNRNSELRADKKPHLADLRESGSVEQDADVVILIHREDMVDPDTERKKEADLIVAKNRGGQARTVNVYAMLEAAKFVNAAPQYQRT